MKPMYIAGRCTLIAFSHFFGSLDGPYRTDGKVLPVVPACGPSVPEFLLTLAHTRPVAGTDQAKFPPASVLRLGYDVIRALKRFHGEGHPPFMHVLDRRG